MDALTAQRALILRELESTQSAGPLWTAADRTWATQVAREAGTTDADGFIAARTAAAWQRLGPRLPGAASAAPLAHAGAWALAAGVLGLLLGLSLDALGGARRINLLAPPMWGVLLWNLLVYALLLLGALRLPVATAWRRRLSDWWARRVAARALPATPTALLEVARPIALARSAQALHLAAAGLGAGLLLGLYWRGLVWDYRATWESTFLGASEVARLLGVVLAPASALTGIVLPDAADLQAIRQAPQGAGPWIHLLAVTLLIGVIVPRVVLAFVSGWQARRLGARFPLDVQQPYFRAMAQAAGQRHQGLWVLAHGMAPSAPSLALVQQALSSAWSLPLKAAWGPACTAGDEDAYGGAGTVPAGHAVVACVDMTATPEPQTQGRWLAPLLRGATPPVLLWVEASTFMQRFGHLGQRAAERRQAWRDFAAGQHLPCVFSDEDVAAALMR